MRQLVAAAIGDRTLDVDLIPVTVMWGRAPDREGSWLRVLLSENWERVGRFRRFLSVVVNGRNLFVQFGEPVSLRARSTRAPMRRAPSVASRARCELRWRGSARRRSAPICRIDARSSRRCCARPRCAAAMADEMRAKKISRREALKLAEDYVGGDRRELLAHLRRHHGARADVVLDAPVRRRRAASLRAAAEGHRRQRSRLRAVPPQPHRLPAAVVRDLLQGLCGAAHRGRHQSEHAGASAASCARAARSSCDAASRATRCTRWCS